MKDLFAPFVNVIILSGVLIYFLREPVRAFVRSRHAALKRELRGAREQLELAEKRARELGARISGLEGEVSALRADSRRETEALKKTTQENTKRLADQYVADAKGFGEGMARELKEDLRRELVEKIFQSAEETIRKTVSGEDRLRMAKEFSQDVGAKS